MRSRIDIDKAHNRAIIRKIGEELQALLRDDDQLPESLRRQINRLRELEGAPPVLFPLHSDEVRKSAVARKLRSPLRWTTRWRSWQRRMRR
jgi:hypothetical protein